MNKKKYESPSVTVMELREDFTLLAGTIIPSGLGTSVPEGVGAVRPGSVSTDWDWEDEEE